MRQMVESDGRTAEANSVSVRSSQRLLLLVTATLLACSFAIVLCYHNIADPDLWAKLALGAAVWRDGELPAHDVFAFTPVLPSYVDHEWGAGLVFYTIMKFFGANALLALKLILAFATWAIALRVARAREQSWPALLLWSMPAALCILPGFVPVIRSHVFTYLCFAATLLMLEKIRAGNRWVTLGLIGTMIAWTNLHGGFVAGLCTILFYAGVSVLDRKNPLVMCCAAVGCVLGTFVNPWGPNYWKIVIPAILHKRPDIVEWQPMPLLANDAFIGFRIFFALTVVAILLTRDWRKTSLPGLGMVLITAVLAWRSRRHAPFFGVASLAFTAPFAHAAARALVQRLSSKPWWNFDLVATRWALVASAVLACFVSVKLLPGASFQVIAPVSEFPVREADILSRAGVSGNMAVPFIWGSYASWRLYPNVKVSIDGRYEAAYPESTYQMSRDLFAKNGPDWDRLLKKERVDFVAIDLKLSRLRPEDLVEKGYVTVWQQDGVSALLARTEHADKLRAVAKSLPNETIQPLNAAIPAAWPGRQRLLN